jgi:hypothetical protein
LPLGFPIRHQRNFLRWWRINRQDKPRSTNDSEEKDPVWELLKHARPCKVAPGFTEGVIREVGQLQGGRSSRGPGSGIFLRAGVAFAAAAALLLGGFVLLRDPGTAQPPETVQSGVVVEASLRHEEISIEEFEAELDELVYMEELMGVSDTSLLADEDLAALLF